MTHFVQVLFQKRPFQEKNTVNVHFDCFACLLVAHSGGSFQLLSNLYKTLQHQHHEKKIFCLQRVWPPTRFWHLCPKIKDPDTNGHSSRKQNKSNFLKHQNDHLQKSHKTFKMSTKGSHHKTHFSTPSHPKQAMSFR